MLIVQQTIELEQRRSVVEIEIPQLIAVEISLIVAIVGIGWIVAVEFGLTVVVLVGIDVGTGLAIVAIVEIGWIAVVAISLTIVVVVVISVEIVGTMELLHIVHTLETIHSSRHNLRMEMVRFREHKSGWIDHNCRVGPLVVRCIHSIGWELASRQHIIGLVDSIRSIQQLGMARWLHRRRFGLGHRTSRDQ